MYLSCLWQRYDARKIYNIFLGSFVLVKYDKETIDNDNTDEAMH